MKKLFLIAALLAGSVMFANAQALTAKSPDQRAAHQVKALTKKLNLADDQAQKISTILLARATKVDSLRANANGDKKATRQALKSIMQTSEAQVAAVLTADQQKTYAELKEARKAKMQKRGDQDMDMPPVKG